MNLSIAIATYNEEKNIGRCLEAVKGWADEIVVVDGSSIDKTREIAKSYGAKVIKTTNKPVFHINKQMAIDKCRGDWVLQLDADEIVSKELKEEIFQVIKPQSLNVKRFVAYQIPRKNFLLGRWLSKGGQYPDYVTRLFERGKAYLPCQSVHEKIVVPSERVGKLKNALLHYPYPNFAEYLVKFNRYTTLTADQYLKDSKMKPNTWGYLKSEVKGIKTFLSLYARHKGFIDGFPGLVFALFSGLHYPVAFIKYWGKKHIRHPEAEQKDLIEKVSLED